MKRKIDKDLLICSDIDDDLIRSHLKGFYSKVSEQKLIDAYFEDIDFIKDLKEVKENIISYDLSRNFLVTTLLYSLRSGGSASFEDLIFGAVREPINKMDIDENLEFLQKWTRLRKSEDRYLLTTELPLILRIERRAELIGDEDARKRLTDFIKKKTREIKGVKTFFGEKKLKKDERFKIAVFMEKPKNIEAIYEKVYENTLALLYPNQSLISESSLKIVKKIIGTEELITEEKNFSEIYKRFLDDYNNSLEYSLKNAEWQLLIWSRTNLTDTSTPLERNVTEFDKVMELLRQYATEDLFKYFIELIIKDNESITIKDLKKRLYRLRGMPLMIEEKNLYNAISKMVEDGELALKGSQGQVFFKMKVNEAQITDERVLEKPPKEVVPPSKEEVYQLIKDKSEVSLDDMLAQYPFIKEEVIKSLLIETYKEYDDIYILESEKIVKSPENVNKMQLVIREEASKYIEPLLKNILSDKLAISFEDAKSDISKYHNGIDDDLLTSAIDDLEISGNASLDRKKNIISLPQKDLLKGLKERIYRLVKKEEKVSVQGTISEIISLIPVEENLIKNAIAELLDEGKIVEDSGYLLLPREEGGPGTIPSPPKKLIKYDGTASDVLQIFNKEISEEGKLEWISIEIEEEISNNAIEEILKMINNRKIKFNARRRII